MSDRQLVKAAKRILKYVVIKNDYTIPLTLTNAAKVIEDCVRENALEDAYNTLQMIEARKFEEELMRMEMGDVL